VKRWGSPTKMFRILPGGQQAGRLVIGSSLLQGAPLRHHIPTIQIEIVGILSVFDITSTLLLKLQYSH
jgi:hypothetical protein